MSAIDLLDRYLRQRLEMGESELVLESSSGDRLHTLRTLDVAPNANSPETRPAAVVPGRDLPVLTGGALDEVAAAAHQCTACGLAATRSTVVFGEGNREADLVVVGEAPGADEDRSGRPFVGRAGQLLNQLLLSVGFAREDIYICNVLKCRPPGNRNPRSEEVEACSSFLQQQLALLKPKVILACGTFSAQTLLASSESIGKLRGRLHEFQEIPLVPTYHPAALLRNPAWIRPVWEDLQRLRAVLDAESSLQ